MKAPASIVLYVRSVHLRHSKGGCQGMNICRLHVLENMPGSRLVHDMILRFGTSCEKLLAHNVTVLLAAKVPTVDTALVAVEVPRHSPCGLGLASSRPRPHYAYIVRVRGLN